MTRDRYMVSRKNRISPDHIRYPSSLRRRADQTFGPYQNRNNSQQLRRRRVISVEPAQPRQTSRRRRVISVEPTQPRQTSRRRRVISVEPAPTRQTSRRRRVISVE
jgi:hypothetical protein